MRKRQSMIVALVVFAATAFAGADTPTMGEAERLIEQEKWDEAVAAFEQITKSEPKNAEAWFKLAYALQVKGDLDRAIRANKKASKFPEYKATALYNIACAYALRGEIDKAFDTLQESQDAGFYDLGQIRSDADLEGLRDDPRFQELRGFEFHEMEMDDGEKLEYGLLLPDDYDASKTYPVLVGMGPGDENRGAAEWGLTNFWGAHAARQGWIVVAPVAPPGKWFTDSAEGYIRQLLGSVRKRFNVEGRKHHIAGCSNGGASAFHLALDAPELFQSVTVVPGVPRGSQDEFRLDRLRGMRVRMFVGTDDGGWVIGSQRTEYLLEGYGVDVVLTVFEGERHVMTSLLGGGFMEFAKELRVAPRSGE